MFSLPKHRMGVHWIPVHQRQEDEKFMVALRPSSIKIINPDPNQVRRCLNYIDPAGVVVLRDHPMSEQKTDMARDPVGTGKRHAREWKEKFSKGGRFDGLLSDRIAVCGINEPYVHDDAEEGIVVAYTKALLDDCTTYGIRVLALNLSVGWPRNLGRDLPPYWKNFLPLEDSIIRGGHFLCTHEYWYSDPDENWFQGDEDKFGWLAHRINACPMAVPIIIGECGMEKRVDQERAKREGNPPWGWLGNISADAFAEQLWRYEQKLNPNVFSIMPFTLDWGSHDWDSQDVGPARDQILRRVRNMSWPASWPVGSTDDGEGEVIVNDPKTLVFPLISGKITGFYGAQYKNSQGGTYAHEGLDLSMTSGTPIFAAADGVVAWSDIDPAYGNYVRTYHSQLGVCFFYGHLSERKVVSGQQVKQGQLIGLSGNTGNSSGPHLHFEVRRMLSGQNTYAPGVSPHGNARQDPLAFMTGWLAAGNKVVEK